MSDRDLHILLTNDDGIDADGLAGLHEEFTALGEVTVVAPATNQSGVGRTRNSLTVRREHPWGYVLEGTPADCVAYGLRGLDTDFDLVAAGVNHGPNAGNYVVGRSGTVGACLEAAFLGTPAVAVSAYHATDFFPSPPESHDFGRPARVARHITKRAFDADVFEEVDLLNVNAPVDAPNPTVQVTEPYHDYDQQIAHGNEDPDVDVDRELDDDETAVRLSDITWPGVVGFENPFPPTDEYRERYPVGTDRRALTEGNVSVSPLAVSHGNAETGRLAAAIESLTPAEFDADADADTGGDVDAE